MPIDDERPPEGGTGPPLPPDDRLWRHPSEVARAVAPVAATGPRLASLVVAAALGGGVALTAAWALGAFEEPAALDPVVERVAAPTAVSARLPTTVPEVDRAVAGLGHTVVSVRTGDDHGSGVILRGDGHVVTTAALVADGEPVHVRTSAGEVVPADVVGVDPATEVAVLAVDGLTGPGAVLGDPTELAVGDPAVALAIDAVGSPEVAVGVVAVRSVSAARAGAAPVHGLIGTDIVLPVPIEGAALVDRRGAVMGITTGAGGTSGVLAVPIDLARQVADDIVRTGAAVHPWLGVEGEDLDAEAAARWDLVGAAHVTAVAPDSPAADGGLRAGDVVVAVGATPVRSMGDLVTALRRHDPGDAVRIAYLRDGRRAWCDAELSRAA